MTGFPVSRNAFALAPWPSVSSKTTMSADFASFSQSEDLPGDVADEAAQRNEKKFLFVHELSAPSGRRGFASVNKTASYGVTNRSCFRNAGGTELKLLDLGLLCRLFFMQVHANVKRVVWIDGTGVKFHMPDDSLFVDDDVCALRPLILLALHFVILEDAVGSEHFLVHVAEERKLDLDLFSECRVCCWGIHTDAKHCGVVSVDFA